jgi:hypothetical protein
MIENILDNPIFNLVFFITFIILFFIIVGDNIRVRIKNVNLGKEAEKSIIEYFILAKKYEELFKKNEEKGIEQTDGFLKFVSESRDWAFGYIEEVQKAIVKLKDESSKVNIMPKSYLVSEELDDLRKAIAEVLKQLPEDSKND